MDPIFKAEELKGYKLPKNQLSTKSQALRYVLSKTGLHCGGDKIPHDTAVHQLAKELVSQWKAADCCPDENVQKVLAIFDEQVWKPYRNLQKSGAEGRSHKKDPRKVKSTPTPVRRSSRTATAPEVPRDLEAKEELTQVKNKGPVPEKATRSKTQGKSMKQK